MAVKLGLTLGNFKWIAKQIHPDLEPEMIIAFSKVECKREPFDKDGFPAILYERHVFYRNVVDHHGRAQAKKWAADFPNICYRTGYGKGGYGSYAGQRKKFSAAFALCPNCSMEACSWGPFQELGENWESCGFENVGQMIDTMKDGLYGASLVFIRSIKFRGLVTPLLNRRYAVIAEKYNGKGYRTFKYDQQIEAAYIDAKNDKTNWSRIRSEEPERSKKQIEVQEVIELDKDKLVPVEHEAPKTGEEEIGDEPLEPKVAIEKPETEDFVASIKNEIIANVTGDTVLSGAAAKAQEMNFLWLPYWFWYIVIAIVLTGSATYLIIRWKRYKAKDQRDLELTQELIKANSTDENKVVFFAKGEEENFKARGYKLVYR